MVPNRFDVTSLNGLTLYYSRYMTTYPNLARAARLSGCEMWFLTPKKPRLVFYRLLYRCR
jgi:hypothetical protein